MLISPLTFSVKIFSINRIPDNQQSSKQVNQQRNYLYDKCDLNCHCESTKQKAFNTDLKQLNFCGMILMVALTKIHILTRHIYST